MRPRRHDHAGEPTVPVQARNRTCAVPFRARPVSLVGFLGVLPIFLGAVGVAGQDRVVLLGQVVESGTGAPIANAVVELVGVGRMLTSANGVYRFDGVPSGVYELRAGALGYSALSRAVNLTQDTRVRFELDVEPIALDSIVVAVRTIDMRGRVRDAARRMGLEFATVVTNQGHRVESNATGNFELKNVAYDLPLEVQVWAYSYLPKDTVLLPEEGVRYEFEMQADPIVQRMIDLELEELVERARPYRSGLMRPLNRDQLLRYRGAVLLDVLKSQYSLFAGRVKCVMMDDERIDPMIDREWLGTVPVTDLERIEFLFGGAMLRIYTREFIRDMMAGSAQVEEPPVYVEVPGGEPFCK